MAKYNVIIPLYNEAGRIKKTCDALIDFLESREDFKFIFVDDGSADNTIDILNKYISGNDNIELLPLGKNCGKGAAVKAGVMHITDGEYVCFIDGDMAYSFNHLTVMFRALDEKKYDVVIGSRSLGFKNSRRVSILRRFLGGGFNLLVRILTGLPYKDTQAGLKGFKLDKAKNIFSKIHDARFWFDVEALFIAKKYRYSIGQIPAIVASEHTLKNTRVKLFSDTIKMFLGLFKIHFYNLRGDYKLED